MIRYADDAVLVFEREEDARRVLDVLPKRFGKYALGLHPEKTRLVRFQQPGRVDPRDIGNFDFLGFRHYWGKTRKGRWAVHRKTAPSRFTRALRVITLWCRSHRHRPVREQHRVLGVKLRGHYAYYGITGNSLRLARFRREVERIWYKWLVRRSQRRRLTWERYSDLLRSYPLPRPRINVRIWGST